MSYCNFTLFRIEEFCALLLLLLLLPSCLLYHFTRSLLSLTFYLSTSTCLIPNIILSHPSTLHLPSLPSPLKHPPPISHPLNKQSLPYNIQQPANKMSQNFNTIDLQPQTPKPMEAHLNDGSRKDIISEQPVCVSE